MDFATRLLHGLAQRLADADLGTWVPEGQSPESAAVAITTGWLPDRDSYIVLNADPMDDDLTAHLSTYAVRVRIRSDETDDGGATARVSERVWESLHGLWSTDLSTGVHLQSLRRSGVGSETWDAAGRTTLTEPYAAVAKRPVPNH